MKLQDFVNLSKPLPLRRLRGRDCWTVDNAIFGALKAAADDC